MNWMGYRKIYFLLSAIVITAGIFSLINWGLKFGLDFQGGSLAEYKFESPISTEDATQKIESDGVNISSVQTTGDNQYLFRTSPLSLEDKDKLKGSLESLVKGGKVDELRFETVGPSIGPELVKKTFYALLISAGVILLWVAYQFKSIKFGSAAILAMFHDSLVLIGIYSIFCHFWGAEVDFLFVTALLTALSFSVHDTIVVYDRIRESQRKFGGSLYDLANKATTETMVRSLNNSFTIIFMLIALILLGGSTLKWFAAALLIGTVSGTYSSPFVAVPILVTWDEISKKIKLRKS
jgi:preprotein translocase subunit SecF